jgi:5-formyltetrahydrofolate cyclo-ligase
MTMPWEQVRAWRKEKRGRLIAERVAMPRSDKLFLRPVISGQVSLHFPELRHACIGFYWPIKGEIDLRNVMRDLLALGAEAALPVVTQRAQPLEFWSWRPGTRLKRGFWNIPIPAERDPVQPSALLVPLVGFDAAGYRLGYGGGYYDRTLAQCDPRPLTIGIGYAGGRLETIHPQDHDIPLDAIVTETEVRKFRYRGTALSPQGHETPELSSSRPAFASPPCSMHELDPAYLGYLDRVEVIELLNLLIEGERAGARAVAELAKQSSGALERATLRSVAMDEAQFCAMLTRHVKRLGGLPSPKINDFYEKVLAQPSETERIDLLNRGQNWVVKKLENALRRIGDQSLHSDLDHMLAVHEKNIRRCDALR